MPASLKTYSYILHANFHPIILVYRYHDHYNDGSCCFLVMERCEEGNLMEFWKRAKAEARCLDEDQIMDKFVQVWACIDLCMGLGAWGRVARDGFGLVMDALHG